MAGGGGVLGRVDNLFFWYFGDTLFGENCNFAKISCIHFPYYLSTRIHCWKSLADFAQCDDLDIEGNVRKLVT